MVALVILLGLFFSLICLFFLRRMGNRILFSIDNLFYIFFIGFTGIVFPIAYSFFYYDLITSTKLVINVSEISAIQIVYYYLCNLLLCIGAKMVFGRKDLSLLQFKSNSIASNSDSKVDNFIALLGVLFLLIGIVCDLLFYKAYGGFLGFLKYAQLLRSSLIELDNSFSFLSPLRNFSIVSTYIFWALLLSRKKNNKLVFVFLFAISFLVSIVTLYANSGRLGFANFFLILFLTFIFIKTSQLQFIKFKYFLFALICCVIFVFLIMGLGVILGRNSGDNIVPKFIAGISFPFVNFFKVINSSIDYRFMIDAIVWPIYFLPQSTWRKTNFVPPTDITTILIMGATKGQNGVTGEIPTDLLTVAYMQIGVWGIVFYIMIWTTIGCFLLKWVEKNIKNQNVKIMMKVYLTVTYFGESILYGDPKHIVSSMFAFFAFMLLYSIVEIFIYRREFRLKRRKL